MGSFAGLMVSVATTHVCCCSTKAYMVIMNTEAFPCFSKSLLITTDSWLATLLKTFARLSVSLFRNIVNKLMLSPA
jgi:hypothetical protein